MFYFIKVFKYFKVSDSKLPRASSLSVYGQGKAQALHSSRNSERSDSGSFSSIDLEDRPHPLAFGIF